MSGAAKAEAELCSKALGAHGALAAATQAYRSVWLKVLGHIDDPGDLNEALMDTAMLVMAAEALKDAARGVEELARATLATAMAETGCTIFRTKAHTVSLSDGRRSAVITDPAVVPGDYMTTPKPDRTAIAAALRRGERIPGCTLGNGGPPYVSFHRREDKTP